MRFFVWKWGLLEVLPQNIRYCPIQPSGYVLTLFYIVFKTGLKLNISLKVSFMLMDTHIGHDMQTFLSLFLITPKKRYRHLWVISQLGIWGVVLIRCWNFQQMLTCLYWRLFFFPERHSESVIPYYLWLCRFADWAVYMHIWPVNDVSQSAEVSENMCCNNTIHGGGIW